MPGPVVESDELGEFLVERRRMLASSIPGTAATKLLSDITDQAVSALAEAAFASLPDRWAVLALGAYGSRRLLPFSDIDLLVITDARASKLREPVAALLYPLWDAGFEVGHAVRSRRDHARACGQELHTLTATLTARHLAGDEALSAAMTAGVLQAARRRRSALTHLLASREGIGSPYALEPELKDGAGGQRDLDELVWRELLGDDPQNAETARELTAAQDAISAARWVLHLAAGRKTALLDDEIAGESGLDRAALANARATAHEVLLVARGSIPGHALSSAAWRPPDLIEALARGTAALPILESAARRGALDAIVPGLSELMTLVRPALSHRLTVGAHSLLTAALLVEVGAHDRLASRALEAVNDRRPLMAAALAHDAGKTIAGPGHALRSESTARATALALGSTSMGADSAGALAREHLLLAETASSEDIDDEEIVLRTAARIGSRELVGQLYVLTAADSLATGPGMWDAWHASLVRTLVSRLDAAFADEIDGAGMLSSAGDVRRDAIALVGDDPTTTQVLTAAPVRYLASRSPSEAASDARLLAALGAPGSRGQFALRVSPGSVPGTHRLAIATIDRPGVFALIAGVVALSGLDALGASADAGPSGTALDTFTVRPATLATPDDNTWATLERYLAAALEGRLDLRTRLMERQRQYGIRSAGRPRVTIAAPRAFATAVRVSAGDRPGLLFDIADEIAAAGYIVTRANALTRGARAHDTFHLVDTDGSAPRDPGALGHLAMRLRTRLSS
ncbi:MAG: hypothetical protein Q7V61_06325 [Actinomycetota bacterium]|nr:hypothetical protein [Actinomycetota bacterium]